MTLTSTEVKPAIEMFESPDVHATKTAFKQVTELLDATRRITMDPEVSRWASIAITQCELASMCAIRALTQEKTNGS